MKNLILLVAFVFSFTSFAQDKYYGQNSTEAILEFESQILVTTSAASINALLNNRTQIKGVQTQLEDQVQHLIGHFQSASFIDSFQYPGVLGKKYDFKLKKIETIEGQSRLLTYTFKNKVNFHKEVFRNRNIVEIPLRLPLDLNTIYMLGIVGNENKCTDHHYNSEGDFFYFWDPDMPGCPLKNNDADVLRFNGKLTKLDNTVRTYPEYDRLYKKSEINIAVFLGYIDEEKISASRVYYDDDALITYEALKDELSQKGFELVEEKREFKKTSSSSSKGINFLAKYSDDVRNEFGQYMKVNVQLFVGDTGMAIGDPTFHSYLKEAYEKFDVVAYDGHSGLGGNLSFETLPKINFTNNYQIYFFNGCSSYPYYNDTYFSAKPAGKKNLEIITSGLPTLSSTSYTNMSAFISPFIKGELASYQALLQRIERSNDGEDTYLMGVNGDEDNKFKP